MATSNHRAFALASAFATFVTSAGTMGGSIGSWDLIITTARVGRDSGLLAPAGDPDSITEFFKKEDVAQLAARPNQLDEEQREAYDVF